MDGMGFASKTIVVVLDAAPERRHTALRQPRSELLGVGRAGSDRTVRGADG